MASVHEGHSAGKRPVRPRVVGTGARLRSGAGSGGGAGTLIHRRSLLRIGGGLGAAAALAPALAACGGSSGGGDTLRLVGVADQKPPLDEALKRYRDTKINASYAPTDQVQTSVRVQLGAGNAPDVHVVYPGNGSAMAMVQLAKAGLLADLSDQSWVESVPDSFSDAYTHQGKTLVYSPGSSVIGAIYNKKVFEQHGVEPPRTWPELLDVCAKLKRAGVVPIALGAQTPWVTQLIPYALVPSTVYVSNPKFDADMAAGEASFADSGWVEAMEMYLRLQKLGYLNDNPNGTTFEQQTSMVATGKAAMAVQVSAVLPAFRAAASEPDDLAMFPFPGAERAEDVWVPAGVLVGLGVSARSKQLDSAKKFLEFLGEPENMNRWCATVAAIPLTKAPDIPLDPVLEPFLDYVEDGKAVPFMDQRWPNAEVQPTHFTVVQELLGGKTTVQAALQEMDKAYRKSS